MGSLRQPFRWSVCSGLGWSVSPGFPGLDLNEKECIDLDNKLEKSFCFNELNNIFPNGWFEYLANQDEIKFLDKYDNYLEQYSDEELHKIFHFMKRVLA